MILNGIFYDRKIIFSHENKITNTYVPIVLFSSSVHIEKKIYN